MKKKVLSIVMMLAIALSLAIGTALVADAANDGDYLGTSANLADSVTVQVKFQLAEGMFFSATAKVGDKEPVDVTANVIVDGDTITVPVDVPVKDIDKVIEITVYDIDENVAVNAHNTMADGTTPLTAKAYLESLVSNAQFGGIATALLSYGAAAKSYFSGATLTAPTAPDFTDYTSEFAPEGSVTGIAHRSCTLMLEEKTSIRYYFTVTEGEITDYTFKVDGIAQTPTASGNLYYVEKTGITPLDLATAYQVEVTKGEETYTCKYSAIDYAQRAFDNTSDDTDAKKAIAKELYSYYTAAISIPNYINITYVTDGTITNENYTTKFLEGTSDGIQLPTVYMGTDIFDGWYTDELFTERATPEVLATKTENVTLYSNRIGVVASTTNYQQSITKDLSGVVKDGGCLTYSFQPDPTTEFTADIGFTMYITANTDSKNVNPTSESNTTNYRIAALYVKNGKIYAPTRSGYAASADTYNQIATYAEGQRIDIVVRYDFRNTVDGVAQDAYISYDIYVDGKDVNYNDYTGDNTTVVNKDIEYTYYFQTDNTPAEEGAADDGYNIDPQKWNYNNVRIWRFYDDNITAAKESKHTMTVYTGKYVPADGTVNNIFYDANGGEITSDTYDTTFTTGNTAELNLPVAAKGTDAFAGWYFDKDGTVKADAESLAKLSSDVTLFAKFVPVHFTTTNCQQFWDNTNRKLSLGDLWEGKTTGSLSFSFNVQGDGSNVTFENNVNCWYWFNNKNSNSFRLNILIVDTAGDIYAVKSEWGVKGEKLGSYSSAEKYKIDIVLHYDLEANTIVTEYWVNDVYHSSVTYTQSRIETNVDETNYVDPLTHELMNYDDTSSIYSGSSTPYPRLFRMQEESTSDNATAINGKQTVYTYADAIH